MTKPKNGFTTGTCAAIASGAAAGMIFINKTLSREGVLTPAGERIEAEILEAEIGEKEASCAVKKDAGDDPDVTDGILIYSRVRLCEESGIIIQAGEGIGRVTKPGLSINVGEPAINKVPREMIRSSVQDVFNEHGYEGGAIVTISAPGGEEIAKKTFNPRLGIEGGISILGSTGIVKPMSIDAIIETIKLEISMRKAEGRERIILTPGNYGMEFLRDRMGADPEEPVLCSNYAGEALTEAYEKGFRDITLAGHAGKLVKVAGGIMNTHSREADCRMEIISANAAFFTEDTGVLRKIADCITTEEAAGILEEAGILDQVMARIAKRALYHVRKRLGDPEDLKARIIIFSEKYGVLGEA